MYYPSFHLLLIPVEFSAIPLGEKLHCRAGPAPVDEVGGKHLSATQLCSRAPSFPWRNGSLKDATKWFVVAWDRVFPMAWGACLKLSPVLWKWAVAIGNTSFLRVFDLSGCLLRHGVWQSCGYASGALIRCLDAFWKWLLRKCLIAIPHIQKGVFFFSCQGFGMPWIAKYTFLLQILGRNLCKESCQAVSSNVNKLIGVAFPVQGLCSFFFPPSFPKNPNPSFCTLLL